MERKTPLSPIFYFILSYFRLLVSKENSRLDRDFSFKGRKPIGCIIQLHILIQYVPKLPLIPAPYPILHVSYPTSG